MRLRSLACLVLLLAVSPASSQPAPDLPKVLGSAEVSLVNIDVVVTDKDGNPVPGLTPADFEVRHGGKSVTITNFREERPGATVEPRPAQGEPDAGPSASAASTAATPGVLAVEETGRAHRRLVLFIDHLALPEPRERAEVFGSLKKILRQSIGPGDEAMIVSWRRAVHKVIPFTGNLKALEYVLDSISGDAVRVGGEEMEVARLTRDDWAYAWAETGGTELSRNLDALQVYADIKGRAATLKGLVTMMAGMEGRKAVLIVSRRFSRLAGAEFGAAIDTKALIDEVIDAANAADVTLHTMNATEWQHDLPSAGTSRFSNPRTNSPAGLSSVQASWMNDMNTLGPMAERTGGVTIGNTNQAQLFAARVSTDLRSWYSLGYPAPNGGNRAADVKVRVNRKGVTVRARRSIVEKSPEEQMKDRTLANLFKPDSNSRMPIQVAVSPATPAKKGRFRMPVQIRIPLRALVVTRSEGGAKGAVSVFIAAAGPAGEFSDVTRQSYPFQVSAPGLADNTGFLTYAVEVEVASPDSRISIAVWDEVGKEAGFHLISPSNRGVTTGG